MTYVFDFNTVITLGALLVSIVLAFGTVREKVSRNDKEVHELREELTSLREVVTDLRLAVSELSGAVRGSKISSTAR